MNVRVLLTAAAAPALAALLLAAPRSPAPPAAPVPPAAPGPAAAESGIFGFLRRSLPRQREIEALLLSLPDASKVEAHARVLTEEPHVAGTPENARVQR